MSGSPASGPSPAFDWRWRWDRLFLCHCLAFFILISWLLDPLRTKWDWADELIFLLLNGSLITGSLWQRTVAFANTKLYDKLSTLVLVAILLGYVLHGWREEALRRFLGALVLGLYMLLTVNLRRELELFEVDRLSPSLVLQPFHDLARMFPELRPKTVAHSAFPSDHAISCVVFVGLFWRLAGWKAGLAALLLMPLFVLPRMISGAHWLTDGLIGGLFVGLLAVTWAIHTPLLGACCRLLVRPIAAGWRLLHTGPPEQRPSRQPMHHR